MGVFGRNLSQTKLPGNKTILALRVRSMEYHDGTAIGAVHNSNNSFVQGLADNCGLDWEARGFTLLTNSYSS